MDGKAISGFNPGSGVSFSGTLTASAPITLTAGLNIGLSTVPVTKGGTGMTAVGPASTVLTSNGTILAWTPITTGGTVTSVTASAPLQVTGVATDPVVSLQTNPTINNPTFTTPKLGAAEATSLKITGLTASRLVLSDADKTLTSVTTSGSAGQVLTISGGVPSWQNPSSSGTVTSVGLTVPSIFQVTPASITSSGTFSITTTNTPTGIGGGIVLADSPVLTTPTIGAAEATSLKITTLTASRLVLSDVDKKLTSLAAAGSNGQVLTISGGAPTWQTPAAPGTGTVTSVGLTTGSALFSASGTVTTSGNLSFTTISAPSGTGTQILLSNAPVISGTTTFTLQDPQVLTLTGNNLRPAYIGCTYTGASFGAVLTMGVNQFGRTGGAAYSAAQEGGSYAVRTDTGTLHTWVGKPAGSNANNVIMTLDAAGLLQLPGTLNLPGLTASRLVLTDASKNLSSVASAGSEGEVLTIVSGVPAWQAASPFAGSFTGTTSSNTVGTLNVTNNSTTPGCTFSALTPNMVVAQAPFLVLGRASSTNSSAVIQYVTDSITAPTAGGSRVQIGLYGSPALWVYGNGSISVNGSIGVSGAAAITGNATITGAATLSSTLTVAGAYTQSTGAFNINDGASVGGRMKLDTDGNLKVKGLYLGLSSFQFWNSASSGLANTTWTTIGSWSGVSNRGYSLTLASNLFSNNTLDVNRDISIVVSYTGKRQTNGFGRDEYRFFTLDSVGGSKTIWSVASVAAKDYVSLSAHIFLPFNYSFGVEAWQDGGVGDNIVESKLSYIIL